MTVSALLTLLTLQDRHPSSPEEHPAPRRCRPHLRRPIRDRVSHCLLSLQAEDHRTDVGQMKSSNLPTEGQVGEPMDWILDAPESARRKRGA